MKFVHVTKIKYYTRENPQNGREKNPFGVNWTSHLRLKLLYIIQSVAEKSLKRESARILFVKTLFFTRAKNKKIRA